MDKKLKRIISFLFSVYLFSLLTACNSPKSKTTKGNTQKVANNNICEINGFTSIKADSIFLLDNDKAKINASTIKNNKFSIKINPNKKPIISYLKIDNRIHPFILENAKYNVLIDTFSMKILGGKLNTKFINFLALKDVYNNKKIIEFEAYKNKDKSLKNYLKSISAIEKEQEKKLFTFIIENSENVLALYFLKQSNISSKNLIFLQNQLTNSSNTKLKSYLKGLVKQTKLAEVTKKIERRPKAIDFSGTNLDGKTTTLSQVIRGKKAVLIDFWASWCGPCRAVSPSVRRLYLTYKKKGFDIVTVSQDRSINEWEVGVYDDGMQEWNHVYDANNYIASSYGVRALPFMVLLDDKGRIVKKNISLTDIETYLKKNL